MSRDPLSRPTPDPRRILVVANDTVDGRDLRDVLRSHGVDLSSADIRMVAPALSSRIRFWSSDIDRARRSAEARLRRSLVGLDEEGGHVEGLVGDCEPLLAIADELREFDADEIILVTHPAEEAHWVEHGLVERARERFPAQRFVHLVTGARRVHPTAA